MGRTAVRAGTVLALDTPYVTLAEVEHALLDLGRLAGAGDAWTLCTHEIRDALPHYAVSITFDAPPPAELLAELRRHFAGLDGVITQRDADAGPARAATGIVTAGIEQATAAAQAGHGGRAVLFPGWAQLVGTLPIGEALERSALDRLSVLGGGTADPQDLLDTRDFVRPRWQDGELVLAVLPAGHGMVAPFEVPNPTPCCAVHG